MTNLKENFPQDSVKKVGGYVAAADIRCRICGEETFMVLNLRHHPFANALVSSPLAPLKIYPLALMVCRACAGAQLNYCADEKELYVDYIYITPDSTELKEHYGNIVSFLMENNYLDDSTAVLEIGSNIGRFLSYLKPHVRSVLGVDPAANISKMAVEQGIPTVNDFFNRASAERILEKEEKKDLIVARHCFAHNEKPWSMLEGVQKLLAPDGTLLIENAYFLDTVQALEFDQIYHEHMYYYTLRSIRAILDRYDMKLVDCMHSPIHGGTMIYIGKFKATKTEAHTRVDNSLALEKDMHRPEFYREFISHIQQNKRDLMQLLGALKSQGAVIHAYGASAKSTTLLNYYGIDNDTIPVVVDSTVTKHGKYVPLVNIKVISEEDARANPPDYYLLTIWNYRDEIIRKVRSWGNQKSKFILPHPKVEIIV